MRQEGCAPPGPGAASTGPIGPGLFALAPPASAGRAFLLYPGRAGAVDAAMVAKVARATASGDKPGPAGSLGKLLASDNMVRIGDAASHLLGSALVADTGEWGQFAWSEHVLGAPGYRLAGGTDEIQRNIIAERVLGLPAEHRADKAPFSQLAKS